MVIKQASKPRIQLQTKINQQIDNTTYSVAQREKERAVNLGSIHGTSEIAYSKGRRGVGRNNLDSL